jgi:hypothetical protein
MPVQEDVGMAISSSLFSRRDENGNPEESLVDYLCIQEQDQHGVKTRWLILAGEWEVGTERRRERRRAAERRGEERRPGQAMLGGAPEVRMESADAPVTKMGKAVLHKAKQNSNGSFSKGKTWMLDDMRQMEQSGVSWRRVCRVDMSRAVQGRRRRLLSRMAYGLVDRPPTCHSRGLRTPADHHCGDSISTPRTRASPH